jgi:hypothetical protein
MGVALLLGLMGGGARAGQVGAGGEQGQLVTLDSVVAVVNGDLILESDLDAERRFAAFEPISEPQPVSRERMIERLIDRELILERLRLQPGAPITDAQVDAQLATLRKTIPECAAYKCETDAGWAKFISDQGFTLDEVRERWRVRMEVLQFVEERFRMGIRIQQSEIDDYYKTTLAPAFRQRNATPPAEATVSDRIQEVLLQQQVTALLDDWLKALRVQGSVQIVKPGEELP